MNQSKEPDRLLNCKEVMQRLNCSKDYAMNIMHAHGFKIGSPDSRKGWRMRESVLEKLIREWSKNSKPVTKKTRSYNKQKHSA